MKLDGKHAFITGASRGIGHRMALSFADAGAKVFAVARRADALKALTGGIANRGGEADFVAADMGIVEDCERAVKAAEARFGPIDILVNNAAISGPSKFVRDLAPSEWDELIRVNLTAAYATIHYAVGAMMDRKSGAILNIGSFNGKFPIPKRVGYAASKMGMIGLTRSLAAELGPFNIRINSILPGPVEGERVQEVISHMAAAAGREKDQVRQDLLNLSPMRQMADEDDICRLALFLCSEYGRHMTGQDMNVSAGIVMY
jgi:NAD(P)-dependent dehydrogenase (short-subunit alcohol dehydrogenase family)